MGAREAKIIDLEDFRRRLAAAEAEIWFALLLQGAREELADIDPADLPEAEAAALAPLLASR